MRKLLIAVAVTLGFAALARATCDSRTTTCFTNVDISGALTTGSSNITTSPLTASDVAATYGVTAATITTTGAATIGGVINTASGTPYAIKFSSKTAAVPTGTPSATGILAVDNSNLLYISTSTNAGGWQKVGAQ